MRNGRERSTIKAQYRTKQEVSLVGIESVLRGTVVRLSATVFEISGLEYTIAEKLMVFVLAGATFVSGNLERI